VFSEHPNPLCAVGWSEVAVDSEFWWRSQGSRNRSQVFFRC
jgi:hypothetical protein